MATMDLFVYYDPLWPKSEFADESILWPFTVMAWSELGIRQNHLPWGSRE